MRLIYDGRYDYIAQWRFQAHCWLRVYVPDAPSDLPVVVAVQMPDNEGTSITNWAERLAWNVEHDPQVWAPAPAALKEGFIWIQHYPAEEDALTEYQEEERFSRVTFAYDREAEAEAGTLGTFSFVEGDPAMGEISDVQSLEISASRAQGTLGEPMWKPMTRREVEQLIGQSFLPVGDTHEPASGIGLQP